jgi:hypothetical protein
MVDFPLVAGATGCHCVGPPGLEGRNPGLVLVCSLSGLRGHDALRKSQVLDTMRSLVQRQLHTPYRRMPRLLCRSNTPDVYQKHQPRRGGTTPCRGRQAPGRKKNKSSILSHRWRSPPAVTVSALRAWGSMREAMHREGMGEKKHLSSRLGQHGRDARATRENRY